MNKAARPYVICHMVPSVDGRIVTKSWNLQDEASAEYERAARTFGADAWMIGRVSMEPYAGKSKVPKRKSTEPIPRKDFIAKRDAESYAIALDPSGKLTWKSGSIDEEHVITVLTEEVSDDYLAFLQQRGVSYLFGGAKTLNLKRVLQKLAREFGIQKLLLEGGGKINGSFLAADLIDELSLLLVPVADGGIGTPSLFDAKEGRAVARPLELISMRRRKGDLLWLRYRVKR
ncbi:RibD family protein [Pyxidicoccus xibeiensis]|uniref:RibD family protein n=1 Tax=Pyxidicoccus xibeiensis TaxID=2906759 RepID=UPI0020A78318|nr:RibD family protein [Pyxidicoccus xibeiensis]MCP3140826.1 RibD family protein [Pyxidicoccus xibeiensis]